MQASEGTLHLEATTGGMDALVFNNGVVTINTTTATVTHSGGGGVAFGQIEDRVYNHNGTDIPYAVTIFNFDKIELGGSVLVVLKGENPLSLRTRNNGDITIGADIIADGGKGSGEFLTGGLVKASSEAAMVRLPTVPARRAAASAVAGVGILGCQWFLCRFRRWQPKQ